MTCLLIKARVLGLFLAFGVRSDEELLHVGTQEVSSQSLLAANMAIANQLAKSCPRSAEIEALTECISVSMIC